VEATRRGTFLSFQPPAITEEEIEAVSETLRSGWLTTGPRTAELEARMREYLEAKHVLAVSSCTAALHLSLVALGVGPGDEVITTSITWPATANVIVHCGATPVFADVREDTLNIDPAHVGALITEQTKAIIPVDLYGQAADLDELAAFGNPIVEDAAHATESRYRGRKVGAIADLTCFSLYATKNIAAGEGGLISTNRDDLADALDGLFGDLAHRRRPERFFFLRGPAGGAFVASAPFEPDASPFTGLAAFAGVLPFPSPASAPTASGSGGGRKRLMKSCWPIVQKFVVTQ
jgi:dTDP-4-amino-4,6-dideoxygalactose transaminase